LDEGTNDMRLTKLLAVLLAGFALSGCVLSLHPLYTEQDLIFDPALIGEWVDIKAQETWTLSKSAEKEYKLVYVDKNGEKGEFDTHLLKVGDRQFLDLFPAGDSYSSKNNFYRMHLLPIHTFMQIRKIDSSLQMAILKLDWLDNLLKENPGAVRHEKPEESIILLTDQPKDLQAFLAKYAKTADAWTEWTTMQKADKP